MIRLVPLVLLAALSALAAAIEEEEPNDRPETAQPLEIGETVAGVISEPADSDWFSLEIMEPGVLTLDVDAQVDGSPLDTRLILCDPASDCFSVPEGQHLYAGLRYGASIGDSWHRSYAAIPGRYTVGVLPQDTGQGGPEYTYTLTATLEPPPAGEPMSCRAPAGSGGSLGAAAGAGSLYYITARGQYYNMYSVRERRGETEHVSIEDPIIYQPSEAVVGPEGGFHYTTHRIDGIAVDGFGDIVVSEIAQVDGAIHYLSVIRDGRRYAVLDSARAFGRIAAAPGGGLWVTAADSILQYGASGTLLSGFDTGGRVTDLSVAPDSTLYFVVDGSVFRRRGGGLELVRQAGPVEVTRLAFDAAGDAWVATRETVQHNVWDMQIQRLSPGGALSGMIAFSELHRGLYGMSAQRPNPTHITFLRDGDGSPTRELVVGNFDPLIAVVINFPFCAFADVAVAAVPAPGYHVPRPDPVKLLLEDVARVVLGEDVGVPEEGLQLVDAMGNRDGQVDVGDLYGLRRHLASATVEERQALVKAIRAGKARP